MSNKAYLYAFWVFCSYYLVHSEDIKVYFAHEDLQQNEFSGLQLKDPSEVNSSSITICVRFMAYILRVAYVLSSMEPSFE